MKPVSPVIPGGNYQEVVFAKDQPEYIPLPVIYFQNQQVLSRWHMDDAEKLIVAATGEVFIHLLLLGREVPEINLQVNNPIGWMEQGEMSEKVNYAGSKLPVLKQTPDEIWMSLKLTEEDLQTVIVHGDIYFFIDTKGQSLTPSMIQVENPIIGDLHIAYCMALRKTEESLELAKSNGIEVVDGNCCVCNADCFISKISNETMVKHGAKILCTVCGEDSSAQWLVMPETLSEVQDVLSRRKQD